MDQDSNNTVPALQGESSKEICGSTHSVMLSEGAELPSTHGQWVEEEVGGGIRFLHNNNN